MPSPGRNRRFFTGPSTAFLSVLSGGRPTWPGQAAEAEELSRRQAEAEQELQVRGQPMDLRDDLRETYIRMPEEKREYLRQFMEKTKDNMERSPQLYSNFIRSVFMRFLLEQQMMMEDAAVGCEEVDPDLALLWRDISGFKDSDIPRRQRLSPGLPSSSTPSCPDGASRGDTAVVWISKKPSAEDWRREGPSSTCPSGGPAASGGCW